MSTRRDEDEEDSWDKKASVTLDCQRRTLQKLHRHGGSNLPVRCTLAETFRGTLCALLILFPFFTVASASSAPPSSHIQLEQKEEAVHDRFQSVDKNYAGDTEDSSTKVIEITANNFLSTLQNHSFVFVQLYATHLPEAHSLLSSFELLAEAVDTELKTQVAAGRLAPSLEFRFGGDEGGEREQGQEIRQEDNLIKPIAFGRVNIFAELWAYSKFFSWRLPAYYMMKLRQGSGEISSASYGGRDDPYYLKRFIIRELIPIPHFEGESSSAVEELLEQIYRSLLIREQVVLAVFPSDDTSFDTSIEYRALSETASSFHNVTILSTTVSLSSLLTHIARHSNEQLTTSQLMMMKNLPIAQRKFIMLRPGLARNVMAALQQLKEEERKQRMEVENGTMDKRQPLVIMLQHVLPHSIFQWPSLSSLQELEDVSSPSSNYSTPSDSTASPTSSSSLSSPPPPPSLLEPFDQPKEDITSTENDFKHTMAEEATHEVLKDPKTETHQEGAKEAQLMHAKEIELVAKIEEREKQMASALNRLNEAKKTLAELLRENKIFTQKREKFQAALGQWLYHHPPLVRPLLLRVLLFVALFFFSLTLSLQTKRLNC
ncbi:hypothetical protein QOT17_021338 [Balamuthia mandrillaris]